MSTTQWTCMCIGCFLAGVVACQFFNWWLLWGNALDGFRALWSGK